MQVVFKNCPPLDIQVHQTPVALAWQDLVERNYLQHGAPLFRDPQKYTLSRLADLAAMANRALGWNWDLDKFDSLQTTSMHKDIEKYLENGYSAIPQEHDALLHEIHFCLHSVESGSKRNSWLQLEWFNDEGFPIVADDYPGTLKLQFGDIRLQNPYVGHHPLYVWEQNDSVNIMQTCRFHDFVRPGICIVIDDEKQDRFDYFNWDTYIGWFEKHCPDFVSLHGTDTIKKFTGHPVIGKVVNLEDLRYCLSLEHLELESLHI